MEKLVPPVFRTSDNWTSWSSKFGEGGLVFRLTSVGSAKLLPSPPVGSENEGEKERDAIQPIDELIAPPAFIGNT